MNKPQEQDAPQNTDKPVPDGNRDAFNALLKRACEPRPSEPEDETSTQA